MIDLWTTPNEQLWVNAAPEGRRRVVYPLLYWPCIKLRAEFSTSPPKGVTPPR